MSLFGGGIARAMKLDPYFAMRMARKGGRFSRMPRGKLPKMEHGGEHPEDNQPIDNSRFNPTNAQSYVDLASGHPEVLSNKHYISAQNIENLRDPLSTGDIGGIEFIPGAQRKELIEAFDKHNLRYMNIADINTSKSNVPFVGISNNAFMSQAPIEFGYKEDVPEEIAGLGPTSPEPTMRDLSQVAMSPVDPTAIEERFADFDPDAQGPDPDPVRTAHHRAPKQTFRGNSHGPFLKQGLGGLRTKRKFLKDGGKLTKIARQLLNRF